MIISKYGWIPDLPDFRDHIFKGQTAPIELPTFVDLRSSDADIYDQGNLNSCTANAIAGMFQFVNKKNGGTDFLPSRLFIYYNERDYEYSVTRDSGAFLRDGMKSINKEGVCKEPTWPYDTTKYAVKPSTEAYTEALDHQAISYQRLDVDLTLMKQCLAEGYPFVFGFSVYESFESEEVQKTGIVPMPIETESLVGGHAVMAIGYDDAKKIVIVRNSFGTDWGDKGYFYMPYDYIQNSDLCDDFWTLRQVEIN